MKIIVNFQKQHLIVYFLETLDSKNIIVSIFRINWQFLRITDSSQKDCEYNVEDSNVVMSPWYIARKGVVQNCLNLQTDANFFAPIKGLQRCEKKNSANNYVCKVLIAVEKIPFVGVRDDNFRTTPSTFASRPSIIPYPKLLFKFLCVSPFCSPFMQPIP